MVIITLFCSIGIIMSIVTEIVIHMNDVFYWRHWRRFSARCRASSLR